MKVFHCDHCQHTLFFENTSCTRCGYLLAFLPDIDEVAALEPAQEPGVFKSLAPASKNRLYRLCGNYSEHQVCNWGVPADEKATLCRCCRLTRVVPNLELPGSIEAWRKLEAAKRRLVYSLLEFKLPLRDRVEDPEQGLAFDFLSDALAGAQPVLTGHASGVITINIAEADDVERERRRLSLHEPYRTLLGHFRHEIGHYYWDLLVRGSEVLDGFRELFGDEREDYSRALKRHYDEGPAPDWSERFITSYASSHPWEDWAETWAHYMHIVDALETATACGVALAPPRDDEPSLSPVGDPQALRRQPFDRLIDDWLSLTYVLNNLSRSLGQPDSYPFVLVGPAIDKLRFVHEVVQQSAAPAGKRAPAAPRQRSRARSSVRRWYAASS